MSVLTDEGHGAEGSARGRLPGLPFGLKLSLPSGEAAEIGVLVSGPSGCAGLVAYDGSSPEPTA